MSRSEPTLPDPARLDAADREAVRSLSSAYASGVDRRRYRDVADLFTPNGQLQGAKVDAPDELLYDLEGRAAIEAQLQGLDHFRRTFHQLGQIDIRGDGDEATGEVYCTASHITIADGSQSLYVMYIRYDDRYRRGPEGWRIDRRFLWIDATERRRAERPARSTDSPPKEQRT